MWKSWKTNRYEQRYRRYEKNGSLRPALVAVTGNLFKFRKALDLGGKVKPFTYGFLKDEGGGVLRISESGAKNIPATRLYVHADEDRKILYLLSIGDKGSQSRDIKECKDFVAYIRAHPDIGQGSAGENGSEENEDGGQEERADAEGDG